MQYYTVPLIGTGTDEDPYRPDVPEGVSWVGQTDGKDFFIITTKELPDAPGRVKQLPWQAVENATKARGLKFNDVKNKWWVKEQPIFPDIEAEELKPIEDIKVI